MSPAITLGRACQADDCRLISQANLIVHVAKGHAGVRPAARRDGQASQIAVIADPLLYYAFQAYNGKMTEIPLISEFVRKQRWV